MMMKSITDICEINPPKKEIAHMDGSTKVSFIPMTSVSEEGQVNLSEVRMLDEVRSGFTYFSNGDVLFAKITPCMENGKGALVNHLVNGVGFGSTEFHVLRPKENIDGKWLYYVTKSKVFRSTAEINMTGSAGQKRVPTSFFDKYKVFVPTLDQQKRIAQILDKAQQLIDKRKEQIEACDKLIKSQFIEMFGMPHEMRFTTKTLPQIITGDKNALKRGPFGGSLKKDDFVDKGYLVYEQRHAIHNDFEYEKYYITEEKYREMEMFKVVPGDLLISCSGVTLGRIAEAPVGAKEGIINQALLKVTLNQDIMHNTFFMTLFRNEEIQDILFGFSRGSGIPNFPSMNEVKAVNFLCPPIELQNQFAEFVQQVDKLKFEMEQSLVELENNFNALMQKAFKGELF